MAVRLVIRASTPTQKAGNPPKTSTSSNDSVSAALKLCPHHISHRAAGIFGVSVQYLPCCDAAIAKRHATATLRRCIRPWRPAIAMVLPSLLNLLVDSDKDGAPSSGRSIFCYGLPLEGAQQSDIWKPCGMMWNPVEDGWASSCMGRIDQITLLTIVL